MGERQVQVVCPSTYHEHGGMTCRACAEAEGYVVLATLADPEAEALIADGGTDYERLHISAILRGPDADT